MKKLLAIIFAAILLLSGCGAGNVSLGRSEEIITDTDILKIKITDVSSSEIALEIVNESKCEIGYEEYYSIEFSENGEWHKLKPKYEASFIEVAYILEKESTSTWGDSISRIYGELPQGEYRIIKHFTIYGSENDQGEKCTLAARFKIG
ncbi:MAG: hypothetical protein IJ306_02930 [Oscillospiraceae bacterium]|nr:hypothetical protein [Oscillospiraceae bacterium]